ncbi:alpha/beta fold hydrolase [Pseudomonas sp. UBA4194]|jgi:sigma-B regulation protein RsbQ|uniref:alpha/beta fold hydrolase n=1 Tax=Pseudomonas sp. UBA4194 TaxID=1947317 RepID=UPI0025EEADE9|nr:alpha/beta hydrolase [Pseudomonas sp. UBA4194]
MSVQTRNNVVINGAGSLTLVFAHGFGCDQNMWRYVEPAFSSRYRTVLFDHVGCGRSQLSAYDVSKYASLNGYAQDIAEVIEAFGQGPVVFVGHSVSAMAGALAANSRPGLIAAHVMIGPSPSYINEPGYPGGFSRDDIDSLLDALQSNYLGWSSAMAPSIMGNPEHPELGLELTESFCQTDPEIAKRFARVTFLSDNREDAAKVREPALVIQSSDDFIAPLEVGEYLTRVLEKGRMQVVENTGHCPHLSQPAACIAAIETFLDDVFGSAAR